MRILPLIVLVVAVGCTSAPAAVLKKIGDVCAAAGDCGSGICRHGKCTKECSSQGDCPVGTDCGLTDSGGPGAICYKSTFDTTNPGGFGADCSVVAADPMDGRACDPKAQSPCAGGFSCRSSLKCDPDAYCTKGCASEIDCPPTMFCGADSGPDCMDDTDCRGDRTCMPVPGGGGAIKVCQGPLICLKRVACSSCATQDQCGGGLICAADAGGARFCGKPCNTADDCPKPANDNTTMNPSGSPFETCVPAGAGLVGKVCAPTVGSCHGPSPLKALSGKQDTFCSWCRVGMPSDCQEGYCIEEQFTKERFCTQRCTVHLTKSGNTYRVSSDPCATGTVCFVGVPQTCGSACDATGVCGGDPSYADLTCYPL
jgi:hypothetical protein